MEPSIIGLIHWETFLKDLESYTPIELKPHLAPIVNAAKDFHEQSLHVTKKWIENSLTLTEACLDKTWEILNSGYWKDVPIEYRYCYTLCTITKAILLELQYKSNTEDTENGNVSIFESIIQQVDKGILLGAPLPNDTSLLTRIASQINKCFAKQSKDITSKKIVISYENVCNEIIPGFSEVTCYEEPSLESFYKNVFMPKLPAIIKGDCKLIKSLLVSVKFDLSGCIDHWNALKKWQDLDYLHKIAGSRTVPIEIGSRYTEDDWTQQLINFSDFLQKHISAKSNKVGYLAQHQLFEQIPELKDDFAIPEFCNFSENEELEEPDINAWFGPEGTISPLHFDPKNNLLCQVFGCKRVILYNPDDTLNLYPYDSRLLHNTAQVDPMRPDYNKWPNFVKARGAMCYLKPGEMLYIPPRWWHHVTALTPSFSISFWWN